jgi:acyl-CoA synthetase (AMP-forming)/AMP-acid ligase II
MPAALMTFGTIILARRFSRREFWADIRKSDANAILYIGEMLRYLVQSPPDPRFPDEKDHHVTLAFGLGLAPTVWKAFRERFGVDWIVEYYSATEATTSLVNSTRNNAGNGKVAHWGPLMRRFGQDTFYIVKADLVSGEIIRDPKTGFCIPAKTDELGEAICRIKPPIQRKHDYVGELGAEATEKKTLRDVFIKGDEFFRLGDALFMDADGYISFSDRLGDTYRVKGHNISTTEVENCLSHHPDVASVNVYAIPMNQYGYEGQLGCAAIEFHAESWDRVHKILGELEQWMINAEHGIPAYAIPRFLRVIRDGTKAAPDQDPSNGSKTERVSTIMKKLKVGLRKDGFSPVGCEDQMYWIEKEGSGYVPLVEATAQSLRMGQFRL